MSLVRASAALGPLSCQVIQSSARTPELAVVLCHGYGAPGDDLVALGPELLALPALSDRSIQLVFPAAPLAMDEEGGFPGRAWWELDWNELAMIEQGGLRALETWSRASPPGLAQARTMLRELVDALSQRTALPLSRIVLGGFSQGAMLATDLTLRLEQPTAGLCILSGALIAKDEWAARAGTRRGLPVFQSHGRADPILPYASAVQLRELLTAAGLAVEFVSFEDGHTIPWEALGRLGSFLGRIDPLHAGR